MGRLVVSFSPNDWHSVRRQLSRLAGGEAEIATHRTRRDAPSSARRAAVNAFSRIGIAIVDPRRAGGRKAIESAFEHVRDEHVLRRTPMHFEASEASVLPWSDDALR